MSSKDLNLSVLREVAKREFFALFPANASKEGGRHAGDSHGSSAAIQPKPVVYVDPSLVLSFRALGVIDSDAAREAGLGSYLVLTPELLASGAKPSSVGSSPSCVSYFFIQGQELQRCMRSVRVMMQILEMRPSTGSPTARIVFVPKGSAACQEILIRTYDLSNRFGGTVTVSEFALDFIPLCDDVLSMELPQLFNSGVLDGDPTLGMSVARSLYKLQAVHLGHIPHVRGKGRLANHIARMIKRLQSELGGGSDANALPALVDTMILFDRGEMDPLTPLVTQLTYEGLLEEFYSDTKTSERITLPSDSEQTARAPVLDAEGKPLGTVMLDPTTDTVFAEIRDMNIANVGPTLNQKTLHIKAVYEKRHGMQALSELRDFMKQLPEIQQQHKQVGVHTAITAAVRSETLKPEFRKRIEMEQCLFSGDGERDVGDYLEECIGRRDPLPQVLRLLCIFSHCSSTWRARTYEQFRESLVQSYGALPCLVLLSKLERAGFLRKPDARSVMSNLRKPLQLFTPPRHTETYPDGIAFAYSGYAPPLVRLAEVACRTRLGWKAMDSLLNLFPGESYADDSGTDVLGNTRFVLVVFLGGITCAEISALRFLSSKEKDDGVQVRFIVATTQVINGNNVLQLMV